MNIPNVQAPIGLYVAQECEHCHHIHHRGQQCNSVVVKGAFGNSQCRCDAATCECARCA